MTEARGKPGPLCCLAASATYICDVGALGVGLPPEALAQVGSYPRSPAVNAGNAQLAKIRQEWPVLRESGWVNACLQTGTLRGVCRPSPRRHAPSKCPGAFLPGAAERPEPCRIRLRPCRSRAG